MFPGNSVSYHENIFNALMQVFSHLFKYSHNELNREQHCKTTAKRFTMNGTLKHLLLEYNKEYANNLWPGTLYSLICLVVGLSGNGYVLFIYKFKLKDNSESRYFIPYLTAADAFCCFITCFSVIFDNYHFLYFPWNTLCKGMMFLSGIAGYVSTLFLLAIAVQRYIMTKKRHFPIFWRRTAIVIISVVSLICSIPYLFTGGVKEGTRIYKGFNLTGVKCGPLNGKYPTFELVYFIWFAGFLGLNVAIILGLYVPIAIVVYRRYRTSGLSLKSLKSRSPTMSGKETAKKLQDTELDCMESPSNRKSTDDKSSNSAIESKHTCCKIANATIQRSGTRSHSTNFNIMFMTIVVMYILTYLPTGVITVYVIKGDLDDLEDVSLWKLQLFSILGRTYVINNIVNPFIYGYFDTQFRKYIKNMLLCFWCG